MLIVVHISTIMISGMILCKSIRWSSDGRAYHAGVLPDSEASLAYFSELNSCLYVGAKLIDPSIQPSNVHPFPSSLFSCHRRSMSWKFCGSNECTRT